MTRQQHAKRTNSVETVNVEAYEDPGMYLKEITRGGADVMIDCSGMSGKMTPLESLAAGLRLQGGALGGFILATQTVRKGGTEST